MAKKEVSKVDAAKALRKKRAEERKKAWRQRTIELRVALDSLIEDDAKSEDTNASVIIRRILSKHYAKKLKTAKA